MENIILRILPRCSALVGLSGLLLLSGISTALANEAGGTDTPALSETVVANTTQQAPGDIPVLLLSNRDSDNTYTRNAFLANMIGFSFDTHSTLIDGIPTLTLLQQYDVVLLWENGLMGDPRPQLTGDVLAQYVLGGGNLVIGTFYWQDRSDNTIYNRNGWGNLEAIDPFTVSTTTRPGSEYNNDTLDAGSIVTHPLTDGLNSMTGLYHGGVAAKVGTTVVASWSDGIPLIGFSAENCIVGISHFPTHDRYITVSGDFYKMWENALNFAALSCNQTLQVDIDIKPGSDPNCFNVNSHGVIPVAVLGSESFDVMNIDPDTLNFGGLEVRVRGKKGPLCGVEESNNDGFMDLVCHFEDDADNWEPNNTDLATLSGTLYDGSEFSGSDSICVVP
ncbi:ThuA domain-containing protein [Vibrio profundum]|uniref:hypothetical protein n=1 Tax=Vibrio profundum TaxID=2910247 RepID=UPI003D0CF2E0